MDKNQKVILFRSTLKLVFIFSVITTFFWLSWNNVVVDVFGVGNRVESWWIFGLPTFTLFYVLRLLSQFWFIIIKVPEFIIYSVILFSWLFLIIFLTP